MELFVLLFPETLNLKKEKTLLFKSLSHKAIKLFPFIGGKKGLHWTCLPEPLDFNNLYSSTF